MYRVFLRLARLLLGLAGLLLGLAGLFLGQAGLFLGISLGTMALVKSLQAALPALEKTSPSPLFS